MRIVVAGQFPPPVTGQNMMIRELYEDLKKIPDVQVEHLSLNFSSKTAEMRKFSFLKIFVLLKVYLELLIIRWRGHIDLTVYPAGGPHVMPIIRDELLLPWVFLLSRKTAIQFHAAGVADVLQRYPIWFSWMARAVYKKASIGIVMTEYCARDPQYLGIRVIKIIPHQIKDEYDEKFLCRSGKLPIILYIGHLDRQKGVMDLVDVLGILKKEGVNFECVMAGEPFPPLSAEDLMEAIRRHHLEGDVKLMGGVYGEEKKKLFGSSDILVFPSRAEQESFGLVQIEGMMWAMPVVSSDWRGNREVVGDEKNCIDIRDGFSWKFAQRLKELLLDREKMEKVGKENRKRYLLHYAKRQYSNLVEYLVSEMKLG